MKLFSTGHKNGTNITFKAGLKIALGIICYWSGLVHILRRYHKNRVIILNFHRIDTKSDSFDMCIHPDTFKKYLEYLRKHYHFISLSDYVRRLKSGKSPIAFSVVLTFDDGYASIYKEVFPLLKRYHIPATVSVVGAWLENGRLTWWDQVENAFRAEMEQASIKSDNASSLPFWRAASKRFVEIVSCLPVSQRDQKIKALKRQLGGIELPDSPKLINKDMAREMVQYQVELINHTYSHAALVTEKPEIQRAELERCEAVLSRISTRDFKAFAYPYGFPCHKTTDLESLLMELGFDCALTNVFGFNGRDSNPYQLKRYAPGEEPLAVFASELAGVFNVLRRLGAQLQSRQPLTPFGKTCLKCSHAIRR
jgi:peptidoglycan/xylan/chitin deacetylase (PgdA/CDA1 family)